MKQLVIVFLMLWGGVVVFFLRGMKGVLSYEVALISFVCVFLSLYFPLRRKMSQIPQRKIDNEREDEKQEKIPLSQKIILGIGLSFSLFHIFAYVFLILALILLLEYQFFDVYTYMIGVFVGLCGVLLLLFVGFRRKN